MVDISELGDGGDKKRSVLGKSMVEQIADATRKPLIEKSSLARLAEDMKSPFADLDFGKKLSGLPDGSTLGKHMQEIAKAQDRLKDAFSRSPIDKLLNGPSTTDAVSRAMAQMEKAINPRSILDDLPHFDPAELPPNPIFETNEHLEQVASKIDALLDVQAKQAELIDLLLKAQIEGGKTQSRMAKWGLAVGFIGVAVAVVALAL